MTPAELSLLPSLEAIVIHRFKVQSRLRRFAQVVAPALAVVALGLMSPSAVVAQNPTIAQVYYVSLPEPDALDILDAINDAANAPTFTYFSIAIARDNTYIYYDQWEDGYTVDQANPTASEIYSGSNLDGTQIWGNGEADDGCPPNLNGTALTCTDGNDVLSAGDVIIPDNTVALVGGEEYVLDEFGAVAYDNNDGTSNWTSDWVEAGDAVNPDSYRDEFGTNAYTNSDGGLNWAPSPWVEETDDGSATGGDVQVLAGQLQFDDGPDGGSAVALNAAAYRQADLSAFSSAILTFDWIDSANEVGDVVVVEVRDSPNAWTILQTVVGNGSPTSGSSTFDITAYIASDTQIRFRVDNAFDDAGDEFYFDNVNISLGDNYRDVFSANAYNNSDGGLDWTPSPWVEETDDGSATGGDVQVLAGQLQFDDGPDGGSTVAVNAAAYRQADLSAYQSATLTYTWINSSNEAGDILVVEARDAPGTWTVLQTLAGNGAASGSSTFDISAYIASDTQIRFRVDDAFDDAADEFYFDNVNIHAVVLIPPSQGDIQVFGNQLRFSQTDADDSIYREANVPTTECTTLSFVLGNSGAEFNADDELVVEVSTNGGGSYTTTDTFGSGDTAGAKSYTVTPSTTMRVRFRSVDALEANEYWTVDDVKIGWGCARDPATIVFDGSDKVASSESISMARAVWATGSGTLNAYAHELHAASQWGTEYESPVGCDTSSSATGGAMFELSGLTIMASSDNTTVEIDADANGAYETSVELDEGEAYLEWAHDWASGCDYLRQGARVRTTDSTKPIQVALLTGDIGSNYETRDMNLLPVSTYGSRYWSPVGVNLGNGGTTAGVTRLFLYNPSSNGSIYITCVRRTTAPTTITQGLVAARGIVTVDLQNDEAANCFASDSGGNATTDDIFGVGIVDTQQGADTGTGQGWDWSFTMFPDNFLSTDVLVGLGLGRDPTSGTSTTQNGSPLWVTPTCETYVYVDWTSDGTTDDVDLNGDGDTADTVDGISEATSNDGMLISLLKSVRLFEPPLDTEPYDQSGARLFSRTASGVGYGGTVGCTLAVAWGEDSRIASAAAPGLDVGTSVTPLVLIEGEKQLSLKTDSNGDGLLSPGDVATYLITIENTGSAIAPGVRVYDPVVPVNTTYVASSTQKDVGSGFVAIPDDGSGTAFPLDVTGGVLLGDLPVGDTWYVRFDILFGVGAEPGYDQVVNCAPVTSGGGNPTLCDITSVATRDWGDLPDSYTTSKGIDGPGHFIFPDTNADGNPNALSGDEAIWLGARVDRETDGQPSVDAEGDDNVTHLPFVAVSDEDGVTLTDATDWFRGTDGGTISVAFSGTGGGTKNAWLLVWFDWNHDGDFADAGEAVVDSGVSWLGASGSQSFTFDIPVNCTPEPCTNALSADLSYRARLFDATVSPGTGAYDGDAYNGEVEDYIAPVASLPVTLSSFHAVRTGDKVQFAWTTAMETGNVGFYLYEVTPSGNRRLNDRLIPSEQIESLAPTSYVYEARGVVGDSFIIEDVDIRTRTRQHGPFDAGTVYGGPDDELSPIDWPAIHDENDRLVAGREETARAETASRIESLMAEDALNGGSETDEAGVPNADGSTTDEAGVPNADGSTTDEAATSDGAGATDGAGDRESTTAVTVPLARLRIDKDGMVLVTYDDLLAAGVDLAGVRHNTLALVNRGAPVPIRVVAAGRYFGPGSTIEFYGEAVDGLYTRTNVYDIVSNGSLRKNIGAFKTPTTLTGTPATTYMETAVVDNNLRYSTAAPGGDPWYDTRLLAFGPPGSSRSLAVILDNVAAGAATLKVETWGGADFPGNVADHHLSVEWNGAVVSDTRFDGLTAHEPEVTLADGAIAEGANTLRMTAMGDSGFDFDIIHVDGATVSYRRNLVARDGHLSFTSGPQPQFSVRGLTSSSVSVFRFVTGKLPVRYNKVTAVLQPDGTYTAAFAGAAEPARYEVVSGSAPVPATIEALETPADIVPSATDYLVITHPNFAEGVQPLVDHHVGRGLRVRVVDVSDVYDRYSGGIFDPLAIKAYVAEAHALGVRYVLLVGGDTYDYLNYASPGAISFIPSLYAQTDAIVRYAPVDPQYADANNDGTPDLAIGRFPVRTVAELEAVVAKTLTYAGKDYGRSAVFAADERYPGLNFSSISDSTIQLLEGDWTAERAYVDELGVTGPTGARAKLIATINQGVAFTSFIGHSDSVVWTFRGLFRSSDAAALTNHGKPTVVAQWGCWNTYFVSPSYNTLGHRFLLSGDQGAAAVLGAATLTEATSEEMLGALVVPRMTAPGVTIGEAVLEAKRELARTQTGLADVLLGWTILGDPALQVEP